MNWHWLLEILEEAMPREDIVLANAFKTRIIAEAQIKTDKFDARMLPICCAAISFPAFTSVGRQPERSKRCCANVVSLCGSVRWMRHRIHRLLGAQRGLKLPQCSDLFGAKGMSFLNKLELPAPAGFLPSNWRCCENWPCASRRMKRVLMP